MRRLLSRRDFCRAVMAAPLASRMASGGRSAARGVSTRSADSYGSTSNALEPFDYSGVRILDGMLRKQALSARGLFLGIPDDNFLVGFRRREGQPAPGQSLAGWYGEDLFNAFGQYVSGMARLSRALGDAELANKAKRLVAEWAKTIGPDGFFFYSTAPKPPHYIYDKTMCGLVDLYLYADLKKEAAALMDRITDWAIAKLDRSRVIATNHRASTEWYTLSENLYRAYEATGDSKFKTFGDLWQYPAYWNMFTEDAMPGRMGFHAYSHVNTLSSCAMAYGVTGDPHYLNVIVNAFRWLERTQMFATGGYGPGETLVPAGGALGKSLEANRASFETVCGSWAGFKLSRYLMTFTGECIYGDWIEKLIYNGIGAALQLQPDGAAFYYSDYTLPGGQKRYYGEKWPCCSGTYSQAIADYHNLIYFRSPDALLVNLFVNSAVTWNHAGNQVQIEQRTGYPETDTTIITVRTSRPDTFAIKFRVPRWCERAAAEVNGNPSSVPTQPGTWASVERRWNDGDRLKISIPMEPIARPVDDQHPNRVAFAYGPVVLVAEGNGRVLHGNAGIARSLVRRGLSLEFQLQGISFVPFHQTRFQEPYQMYFDLRS